MENLKKHHLTRQMHEEIRRVTNRRNTTQTTGIMNKHDNVVLKKKQSLLNIICTWENYKYADDRVTRPELGHESGPPITSSELKHFKTIF